MSETPAFAKMAELYERLPPQKKQAFSWLLANLDFMDAMSVQMVMDRNEWEQLLAYSRERQDLLLEALLLYQQISGRVRDL